MSDEASMRAALGPVRELLQPDGADIAFVSFEHGAARLKLILGDDGPCEGDVCVLPKSLLEPLALQLMQPLVPGLKSVAIEDPREQA
jgi:hypothetical protein